MRKRVHCLTALFFVVLLPHTASAETNDASLTVAVFPVTTTGKVPGSVVEAIHAALDAAAQGMTDVRFISGTDLRKRLKRSPNGVIKKCEREADVVGCLAKVTRKLGVAELLLSRAKLEKKSVQLLVLAVTEEGEVETRGEFLLKGAADVAAQLDSGAMRRLLGLQISIPTTSDEPATTVKAEPRDDSEPEPQPTATPAPASPAIAPTPPPSVTVAALPPAAVVVAEPPPPPAPRESSAVMRWGGVALMAIGGVTGVVGGYYGRRSSQDRSAIEGTTLSQSEAIQHQRSANDNAGLANTLFAVGGGVAFVGFSSAFVDWLLTDKE